MHCFYGWRNCELSHRWQSSIAVRLVQILFDEKRSSWSRCQRLLTIVSSRSARIHLPFVVRHSAHFTSTCRRRLFARHCSLLLLPNACQFVLFIAYCCESSAVPLAQAMHQPLRQPVNGPYPGDALYDHIDTIVIFAYCFVCRAIADHHFWVVCN